ncbi:MAG TPA: PfkB family carbohydrate kinase, partial [Acidimicrobiales bacterium]|nr:PfkB family carbohydrate kinase [Acidimicrobiales bacterium]
SLSVECDELATLAMAEMDPEGRAAYTFYGPATADWQWKRSELRLSTRVAGPAVRAVHTGSLAVAMEPGASVLAEWLRQVRRHGDVVVSLDPNVRPSLVGNLRQYRRRLDELVGCAHVVKLSTDDLDAVAPGTAVPKVVARWHSRGAYLVVVTQGPGGATAFHQSGARVHCPAPAIEMVDTIGAGDAFTAGLLSYFASHGLIHPSSLVALNVDDLRAALALAVAAGAFTCTRQGADPPSWAELEDFSGRS